MRLHLVELFVNLAEMLILRCGLAALFCIALTTAFTTAVSADEPSTAQTRVTMMVLVSIFCTFLFYFAGLIVRHFDIGGGIAGIADRRQRRAAEGCVEGRVCSLIEG